MLNHGRITCSIAAAPSPCGVIRSPSLTPTPCSDTGAESLPRRPRPSKARCTRTAGSERRTRNSVDSNGEAAPGFCALATYESALPAEVTHDFSADTDSRPFDCDHMRDRRPELRARSLLRQRQRRQMASGGDLAEQLRLAGKRRRGGNRLHGADVHDEHHRRGAAALGEALGDRREGAQALAAAAELGSGTHMPSSSGPSAATLSRGKRPLVSTSRAFCFRMPPASVPARCW